MKIIGEKIYRIESGKSGPHFTVFGGVHGNELTGIIVVQNLFKAFSEKILVLKCGTLTLALGNPKAIERGSRGSAPHRDLNRMFTESSISKPENYEAERAGILSPILASSDVMIDLHSTLRTSQPFVIATEGDSARITLAQNFPCQNFVIAPDAIIGGTTDGWAGRFGGTGLGYESGLASDTTKVPETESSVLRIMSSLGMIEQEMCAPIAKKIIEITEAVLMPETGFRFASGRGHSSFETIGAGDTLGYSSGARITALHESLLMFPKPAKQRKVGQPIGFLAINLEQQKPGSMKSLV